MKKILLIKGVSQYDAMRIYIDEYAKGLQNENVDTIIIDAKEDNFTEDLIRYATSGEIDWVFTCNGIMMEDEFYNNIFRQNNISKCTFLYDHPIYHSQRLCLNIILDEYEFERTDSEFHYMLIMLNKADKYIREYFREKMIKTVLESDIILNVHGNGWTNFPSNKKSNLIIREGYGDEALKSLLQTKISLNIMPWFRGGFQERIASAMLSGAISLTDTSDYIEDKFIKGNNIVIYSLKDLDNLPNIITDLLSNPEKAKIIAQNGYEEALKKHTWHHRIKDVLQSIKEFEVNLIADSNS